MSNKLGTGANAPNGTLAVVAPENMGKGLLWDESTDTYYVAVDPRIFDLDELGRLKLRVSALEDNQLKIRDDGVYQGNTARADLSNLYVSNYGNDGNTGTREAPLRTIQEAVNRLENIPAYYRIWLHEGHTFDWVRASKSFTRIIFDVYGDTVDNVYPMATSTNAYYRGYTAKNFPRPTVNVRVGDIGTAIQRQFLACSEVTLRGIRFEFYNKFEGYDDGSKSGHFTGFIDVTDTAQLHGCILNERTKAVKLTGAGAYRDDVIIRSPRVLWIDSLSETLPQFVSSSYTTQLSLISWNHDTLNGYGEKPNHEALIKSATAFQDMSRGMRQKIAGVVFDDEHKSVFGMTLNWDIFNT